MIGIRKNNDHGILGVYSPPCPSQAKRRRIGREQSHRPPAQTTKPRSPPRGKWLAFPRLLPRDRPAPKMANSKEFRGVRVGDATARRAAGAAIGSLFEESAFMRHLLSALVTNQPGVLAHVSGMLASRGFNIESLAVGETEQHDLSRMTFVVHGDDRELEQVRKQLEKLVTVVKVLDISREEFVERDLMLAKVAATPEKRGEIGEIANIFRGRIVDVGPQTLIIEISGTEDKIRAFVELIRPYGIIELARTGRIALVRTSSGHEPRLEESAH